MRSDSFLNSSLQSDFAYLLLFIFLSCLYIRCQEKSSINNNLLGRWEVISATRDGKVTNTLEDGYFDFESDTSFRTNIFSEKDVFQYTRTKDSFTQLGKENIKYIIDNEINDTLVLRSIIREYQFVFVAIKDTLIAHDNTILK